MKCVVVSCWKSRSIRSRVGTWKITSSMLGGALVLGANLFLCFGECDRVNKLTENFSMAVVSMSIVANPSQALFQIVCKHFYGFPFFSEFRCSTAFLETWKIEAVFSLQILSQISNSNFCYVGSFSSGRPLVSLTSLALEMASKRKISKSFIAFFAWNSHFALSNHSQHLMLLTIPLFCANKIACLRCFGDIRFRFISQLDPLESVNMRAILWSRKCPVENWNTRMLVQVSAFTALSI